MKKLSLLLAVVMLFSSLGTISFAEEGSPYKRYSVVEAEGGQIRLTYMADTTAILEADGLKFKDLDKDGELDAYEDWRLSSAERADDLIGKLTVAEKAPLLFMANIAGRPDDLDPETFVLNEENQDYRYMTEFGISSFLDNANGTPAQQVVHHNALQAFGEATGYGIPITLASDREYNTWGGMVDAMHLAYGTAHDSELVEQIIAMQAKEIKALKYQVVFHPSAVELGDSYGDNPAYVAEVVGKEIKAIREAGVEATAKHFIAKPYYSSISPAKSLENWIIPWRSAVENGVGWVMTNNMGLGLNNTTITDFDSVTIGYLRDTLGFNGVIITDWGSFGSHSPTGRASGVTPEGVNLDDYYLDPEMLYTVMLNAGVDMFGSGTLVHGTTMDSPGSPNLPEALIEAVEKGTCDEALLDRAVKHVLVSKFETGMFDDPYADLDEVMRLAASESYLAKPWSITDNATLAAARNQELIALEEKLEAEAAVLLKNDGDLLPLAAGAKVYVTGTNLAVAENYAKSLEDAGYVAVEAPEDADVVIVQASSINDAVEMYMEDAAEAGKPVLIILEAIEPNGWVLENATAVLYNAVKRTPDHGAALSHDFSNYIDPWILADLISGKSEPKGSLVKSVARSVEQDMEDWGDVANDHGASEYVKLILAALQAENPSEVPVNYGNPLICVDYGMRYGESAAFDYRAMTVPVQYERVENYIDLGFFAYTEVTINTFHNVKAGEAFPVYCLLYNTGADGMTTAEIYDGETLLAKDVYAVNGGSWRVVEFSVTLNEIGEHTLRIADMTAEVIVFE